MGAQSKTSQLQLRVTPAEKAELVRQARAAGSDLSSFILDRLLPPKGLRFRALARELGVCSQPAYVFAELNDLLSGLGRLEFASVMESGPDMRLDEIPANQLAAMVETAAVRLGARAPAWVENIPPLRTPWFSTDLVSLRLHLLCSSPAAFRRRNLFVDSTLGDRV